MEKSQLSSLISTPQLGIALLIGSLSVLALPLLGLIIKKKRAASYSGLVFSVLFVGAQVTFLPKDNLWLSGGFLLSSFALLVFQILSLKDEETGFEWETQSFIIASAIGVWLTLEADNLLQLFLALELMSLPGFFLAGLKNRSENAEAALKYFLMGLVSSAIMAYGMSWIYGATGTISLSTVHEGADLSGLGLGLILTVAGLLFKLGAFPFHFWVSDVFRTGNNSLNFWLSTSTKIGGLSAVSLLLSSSLNAFPNAELIWPTLALITLTIGNVLALGSQSFTQLLGFSSIAHTGFMMLACGSYPQNENNALFTYWLYYFPAIAGVFLLLSATSEKGTHFENWKGAGKTMPLMGAILTLVLVNLTGLPPLSGFMAKITVLSTTFQNYGGEGAAAGWWLLAGVLLNTAIALVYYMKLPFYLFFKEGGNLELSPNSKWFIAFGLALSTLGFLQFIYPEELLFTFKLLN